MLADISKDLKRKGCPRGQPFMAAEQHPYSLLGVFEVRSAFLIFFVSQHVGSNSPSFARSKCHAIVPINKPPRMAVAGTRAGSVLHWSENHRLIGIGNM